MAHTPYWMRQVLADLERHEGFREYAYPDPRSRLATRYRKERWGFVPAIQILNKLGESPRDGAPWTVGIGFTRGVTYQSRMSLALARDKLEPIVIQHLHILDRMIPDWLHLPDVVKTVIVNMAFNLGSRLYQFKNSMGLIARGNYKQAASNLKKSAWAKQVGARATELITRLERQAVDPKHRVA